MGSTVALNGIFSGIKGGENGAEREDLKAIHVGLPSPSCAFLGSAVQRRSDHRDDHNPNAHVCDAPVSRQRARVCQSSGCGLKSKDPGGLQQQLNDKLQYLDILSTQDTDHQ